MSEILGFDFHFEPITLPTLVALRELEELRTNACYFLLHVCIDNADTGHTAMALEIVIRYLEFVGKDAGGTVEDRGGHRQERLGSCPNKLFLVTRAWAGSWR